MDLRIYLSERAPHRRAVPRELEHWTSAETRHNSHHALLLYHPEAQLSMNFRGKCSIAATRRKKDVQGQPLRCGPVRWSAAPRAAEPIHFSCSNKAAPVIVNEVADGRMVFVPIEGVGNVSGQPRRQ